MISPWWRDSLARINAGDTIDEAAAAVTLLKRAQPHAPGAQAVVWDNILRGIHLNRILTEVGLVPIVGSSARVGGLELTAENVGGRRNRIDTILVRRLPPPEPPSDRTDGSADAAAADEVGATRSG